MDYFFFLKNWFELHGLIKCDSFLCKENALPLETSMRTQNLERKRFKMVLCVPLIIKKSLCVKYGITLYINLK